MENIYNEEGTIKIELRSFYPPNVNFIALKHNLFYDYFENLGFLRKANQNLQEEGQEQEISVEDMQKKFLGDFFGESYDDIVFSIETLTNNKIKNPIDIVRLQDPYILYFLRQKLELEMAKVKEAKAAELKAASRIQKRKSLLLLDELTRELEQENNRINYKDQKYTDIGKSFREEFKKDLPPIGIKTQSEFIRIYKDCGLVPGDEQLDPYERFKSTSLYTLQIEKERTMAEKTIAEEAAEKLEQKKQLMASVNKNRPFGQDSKEEMLKKISKTNAKIEAIILKTIDPKEQEGYFEAMNIRYQVFYNTRNENITKEISAKEVLTHIKGLDREDFFKDLQENELQSNLYINLFLADWMLENRPFTLDDFKSKLTELCRKEREIFIAFNMKAPELIKNSAEDNKRVPKGLGPEYKKQKYESLPTKEAVAQAGTFEEKYSIMRQK